MPCRPANLFAELKRLATATAPFLLESSPPQDNDGPDSSPYGLPLGTSSTDGVCVVGHQGWLYLKEGSNSWLDQYAGRHPLSPEQEEAWQTLLERRSLGLSALGIRYAHLVVPEKQCIYPEHYPDAVPIQGPRPIEQLRGARGLVYPLEALCEARQHVPVWLKGNSHWNLLGCCVATAELLQALEAPLPDFCAVKVRTFVTAQDLAVKLSPQHTETHATVAPPGREVFNNHLWDREGRHQGNHYVLHHRDAPRDEVVCIFGDSYAFDHGLCQLLSHVYRWVHFRWGTTIDLDYALNVGASIVITQTAERFLTQVPDTKAEGRLHTGKPAAPQEATPAEQTEEKEETPQEVPDIDAEQWQSALNLLEAGQVDAALAILLPLAEAGSSYPPVFNTLGELTQLYGDPADALPLFEAASERETVPGSGTRNLAAWHAQHGDPLTALSLLGRLQRHDPADHAALAEIRLLLERLDAIPPVTWARLISDLRAPATPLPSADKPRS